MSVTSHSKYGVVGAELTGALGEQVGLEAGERDPRAPAVGLGRDRGADPARSAGDEDDLSLQTHRRRIIAPLHVEGRIRSPRSPGTAISAAARRPLRSAPSISAPNSGARCSPAKASGPTGAAAAASTPAGGSSEYAAPTQGSSSQVERIAPARSSSRSGRSVARRSSHRSGPRSGLQPLERGRRAGEGADEGLRSLPRPGRRPGPEAVGDGERGARRRRGPAAGRTASPRARRRSARAPRRSGAGRGGSKAIRVDHRGGDRDDAGAAVDLAGVRCGRARRPPPR